MAGFIDNSNSSAINEKEILDKIEQNTEQLFSII